jgi:hypothetical protein
VQGYGAGRGEVLRRVRSPNGRINRYEFAESGIDAVQS